MKYFEKRNLNLKKNYMFHVKTMPTYVARFVDHYQYLNASENTISGYIQDIELFFYFLTMNNDCIDGYNDITLEFLDNLSFTDIQQYIAFIMDYERDGKTYHNGTTSRSRKLSALRSFYHYFQTVEKTLKNNPAAALPVPKNNEKKDVIALDADEIKTLLHIVRNIPEFSEHQSAYLKRDHYRDVALISLLLGTGLRISECIGIDIEDIYEKRQEIKIHRKGNKTTTVYYNDIVGEALNDYIDLERKPKEPDEKALFLSSRGTRLAVRSAQNIVKKYTERIGVPENITAHKLRSSYATALYRDTRDPVLIQHALSHSNISTVQKYVKKDEEARKKAAKKTDAWFNEFK